MGLFNLLFPEQASAEYLGRIARHQERAGRFQHHAQQNTQWQIQNLANHVQSLEQDVGTLALALAAILKIVDEKGLISREEVRATIEKVDLIDREQDGQISVDDIRAGNFYQDSKPDQQK